jgi:hypothetical protein
VSRPSLQRTRQTSQPARALEDAVRLLSRAHLLVPPPYHKNQPTHRVHANLVPVCVLHSTQGDLGDESAPSPASVRVHHDDL